jgi:hypothetical protein
MMASPSMERRSYTLILFWARVSSKGAKSRASSEVLSSDMLALLWTSNYEQTKNKSARLDRVKASTALDNVLCLK